MKAFSKDKTVTHFSSNMKANYTVDLDSTIQVDTHDCYGGQIDREEILRPDIDRSILNQSTGPFYVNGLTRSDILTIEIQHMDLDDYGIMMTSNGLGILGDAIVEDKTKLFPVKNNEIHLSDDLRIPVRPMIGVIGTAPESGSIHCAVPGKHGGNLDTKDIAPSNTIYLPVYQDGGLFALGDVHASMGDGEMNGTGVEIGARNTLHVSKIEGRQINSPIVETPDHFMFISSKKTLNEAMKMGARQTAEHLQHVLGIDFGTAYRLLSASCDMKISQVVNALVTVRIAVPKHVLPQLF